MFLSMSIFKSLLHWIFILSIPSDPSPNRQRLSFSIQWYLTWMHSIAYYLFFSLNPPKITKMIEMIRIGIATQLDTGVINLSVIFKSTNMKSPATKMGDIVFFICFTAPLINYKIFFGTNLLSIIQYKWKLHVQIYERSHTGVFASTKRKQQMSHSISLHFLRDG